MREKKEKSEYEDADKIFDNIRDHQKPLIGDKEFIVLSGKPLMPMYIVDRDEFRELYASSLKPLWKFW